MNSQAVAVLQQVFGHAAFRGQQAAAVDRVLNQKHAMVLAPTGSGKSVCFQVPALMQEDLAVVLSPLVALMQDQVDGLIRKGVDAVAINASLRRAEREAAYAGLAQGRYRLVYVTPERFRKPEFRQALAGRTVSLLAVDEAHCVSQWGHDFRPDYSRLAEIRQVLGNPTTIALTATATRAVQRDIVHQLGLSVDEVEVYHEGIGRPNLELAVESVWGEEEKLKHIVALQHAWAGQGGGIVYFSLIKTLERFSAELRRLGVEHVVYHGGLSQRDRRALQQAFMSGDAGLVLATNAFGMGVDKADIRTVTHTEVPGSLEAYYQEIGRAGRDGEPALCTLLYDEDDLTIQMNFLDWSNPSAEYYQRVVHLLTHRQEEVAAYGLDWLKEQLHGRRGKHEFRLETALAMLERHGVISGDVRAGRGLAVIGELPESMVDAEAASAKLDGDRRRLLAMVEYAKCEGSRAGYLEQYFMSDPMG